MKNKNNIMNPIHDIVKFVTSSKRSRQYKFITESSDSKKRLLVKYLNDRKFRKYWNKQIYAHINDKKNTYYEVVKLIIDGDFIFPRQSPIKNISDTTNIIVV